MLKEDWCIGFTMLYIGFSLPFAPFFEVLPAEHPLWVLFSEAFPRYVKMGQVVGMAKYVISTCEKLGLKVDPSIPFLDASTHSSSRAKSLWKKVNSAVLADIKFAHTLMDHAKIGLFTQKSVGM